MKITPLEIEEYRLGDSMFGYNKREVEVLKTLCAESLKDARSEIAELSEKLKRSKDSLSEHEERESVLRATITTAQQMVDDMKKNTIRESEFIIAEARSRAEEITKQAMSRAAEIQNEITTLKKQRIELETALRGVLRNHASILKMEEEEARKADGEAEKLKYMTTTQPAVNEEER